MIGTLALPDCVLQKEVGAGLEHKSLGIRSRRPYSPIRDLKARAVFWLLWTFGGGLVVSVIFSTYQNLSLL